MDALQKLASGKNLAREEAESLMEAIMAGTLTPVRTAAALVALKMKGESEEEISSFAKVMRKNAVRINPKVQHLVDTCGTGGDSSYTFNISTAAALIAAGAGIPIAKHGNRSVSGKSGSADVLEQLGARLLQPAQVEKSIEKIGIGFMFAPYFHPAMKAVGPIRKELGIRTVFNILGPLTNPAGAHAQVLGVFDPAIAQKMASALRALGTEHALVVHSEGMHVAEGAFGDESQKPPAVFGMDEIGLGKTKISELKDMRIENYEIDGKDFGFTDAKIPTASSKEESAAIIMRVLRGEDGPARDISVLNAAAAIYVGGKAASIKAAIPAAEASLDSGKAFEKLNELVRFTGE